MNNNIVKEIEIWFGELKSGLQLAERYSGRVDQIISAIYGSLGKEMRAALFATGGYGRRELCPYSDIDIMFFAPDRIDTSDVEKMLYKLWDTGLEISHSFRTPRECTEEAFKDMRTRTSLLEARYIAGDRRLYALFRNKVYPEIAYRKQKNFVREKLLEMERRHLASGESVFLLEPNVKESEGGLRDVHTSYWLSKVARKIEDFSGFSKLLSANDYRRFREAHDFLLLCRYALHLESRRKNDVLSFEYQKGVAGRLGFRDSAKFTATERFMRYYHLKGKIVEQTTSKIMVDCSRSYVPYFRDWRVKRISDDFLLSGGRIVVATDGLFGRDPDKIMEAFSVFAKTGKKFSDSTREKIVSALIRINSRTRHSPAAVHSFLEILKGVRVYETLREMQETGVLGRFIPEFGALRHLVVHEPYHMYTVDEHTLVAVRNLERLRTTKYKNLEDFHEIIKGMERIDTLFMAILFHDIGKAAGRNHGEEGYKRLKRITERFNLDVNKRRRIEFLVKNHILMSKTALRMEPSDSEVVAMFADAVGDAENLRAIYLMTYADMSAVNPEFWSSWKAYLLKELYESTLSYLSGINEGMEEYLGRLRKLCPKRELSGFMGYIDEMPKRYLLATTSEKVIADYRLMQEMKTKGFSMRIDSGPGELAELSISAKDRPGLFAGIVGFLSSKRLNIVNGRIFTGRNGVVIDKISISNWMDVWWEGIEKDLEKGLREVIAEGKPVGTGGRGAKTESPFDIFIELDNEAFEEFTVIEIFSPDRLGLLYDIANVLHGLGIDIISARINTESGLAQDIFYVQQERAKVDYRKGREILSELWTTLKGTA